LLSSARTNWSFVCGRLTLACIIYTRPWALHCIGSWLTVASVGRKCSEKHYWQRGKEAAFRAGHRVNVYLYPGRRWPAVNMPHLIRVRVNATWAHCRRSPCLFDFSFCISIHFIFTFLLFWMFAFVSVPFFLSMFSVWSILCRPRPVNCGEETFDFNSICV
jgi:hypothetical protein